MIDDPHFEIVNSMFGALDNGDDIFRPSEFWQIHNKRNLTDLRDTGFAIFKRTLARTYFTWIGSNDQASFLARHTNFRQWATAFRGALALRDLQLSRSQLASLSILTKLLWLYTERNDRYGLLQRLSEPLVGSPFDVRIEGKLVSQDLANSVLEYQSIRSGIPDGVQIRSIFELGAGYGRNAFVFLSALPNVRYTIIDIPPALYVSQRYVTTVFPDLRAFKFRDFHDYASVAEEYEASRVAFLLPHQARLLPSKSCNLFINISSLHEMVPRQIQAYLELIDRLTSGWFYSKQWRASRNRYDRVVIRENDYPIPNSWHEIYRRRPAVQRTFFEALYSIR